MLFKALALSAGMFVFLSVTLSIWVYFTTKDLDAVASAGVTKYPHPKLTSAQVWLMKAADLFRLATIALAIAAAVLQLIPLATYSPVG